MASTNNTDPVDDGGDDEKLNVAIIGTGGISENALTPAAAAAALAACAQSSDGSLSTMRNKRRLALSAVATYRMEVAEEAAGLDMGELRGEASTAPWASAVL